ncbi:rhodanese-like domain-containing protein [Aliibacillus thermotolerans]|uniref:Rhodanese-like domain-containing protein n=1 Tax=Aliibacillus thermotolerans TaxID=1834418 RepID=A0ABW0U4Z3_9BACI|nr:rhodanese-like domain-containing protein [Aliibacillus thermotolerans]
MAKQIAPEEVAKRLQNSEEVFIIDVRENGEVASGKIPSANNIPLGQLALRKGELDKEKSYVVVLIQMVEDEELKEIATDIEERLIACIDKSK